LLLAKRLDHRVKFGVIQFADDSFKEEFLRQNPKDRLDQLNRALAPRRQEGGAAFCQRASFLDGFGPEVQNVLKNMACELVARATRSAGPSVFPGSKRLCILERLRHRFAVASAITLIVELLANPADRNRAGLGLATARFSNVVEPGIEHVAESQQDVPLFLARGFE
jgi:hypothetical protein